MSEMPPFIKIMPTFYSIQFVHKGMIMIKGKLNVREHNYLKFTSTSISFRIQHAMSILLKGIN